MPRLFMLALSVASFYLWLLMRSLMRAARITAPHHGTGVDSICVHAPPNGTDIGETFQWRGLFPAERES